MRLTGSGRAMRLHYVVAGDADPTIVLLHGFPQTWWQWHRIIPPLVEAGYRVVAPDYRGAGDSWRPTTGYDKRTMAATSMRCCTSTSASASRRSSPVTTSG